MDREKSVDESWKESTEKEKIILSGNENEKPAGELYVEKSIKDQDDEPATQPAGQDDSAGDETPPELTFLNYVTSLGYQAMIFMGEIEHPVTQKKEENFDQAKFLIDTLSMIRDKTVGNLDKQEETLLSASIYELQMRYVDRIKQKKDFTS